jgi:hypothetical protein
LRLDAVHALVDTTAIHVLKELATETDALAEELGRPAVHLEDVLWLDGLFTRHPGDGSDVGRCPRRAGADVRSPAEIRVGFR